MIQDTSYNSKHTYKTGEDSRAFPVYDCWKSMIDRCMRAHTSRFSSHGGRGVKVCEDWWDFQNFAEWYYLNFKEGGHLDKDFLGDGLLYSPETCVFIPSYLNCLVINKDKGRNGLPNGVYYRKDRDKYVANTRIDGVNRRLGSYNTPEKAHYRYKRVKEELIKSAAKRAKDDGYLTEDQYLKVCKYQVRENL